MALPTPGIANVKAGFDDRQLADLETIDTVNMRLPLSDAEFQRVARRIDEWPEISVRFWAFGDPGYDLGFLRFFSTRSAIALDHLNLKDLSPLQAIGPQLRSLQLTELAASCSLAPLARFRNLETLLLWGPARNEDALDNLHELKRLVLRSAKLERYRNRPIVERLDSLLVSFGSSPSLDFLNRAKNLRTLEIDNVRGLANVDFLVHLDRLVYLLLEHQPRIATLPSFASLGALRWVALRDLRGLADPSPVASAPQLEDFQAVGNGKLTARAFTPFVGHPTLKRVHIWLIPIKEREAVERMLPFPRTLSLQAAKATY